VGAKSIATVSNSSSNLLPPGRGKAVNHQSAFFERKKPRPGGLHKARARDLWGYDSRGYLRAGGARRSRGTCPQGLVPVRFDRTGLDPVRRRTRNRTYRLRLLLSLAPSPRRTIRPVPILPASDCANSTNLLALDLSVSRQPTAIVLPTSFPRFGGVQKRCHLSRYQALGVIAAWRGFSLPWFCSGCGQPKNCGSSGWRVRAL